MKKYFIIPIVILSLFFTWGCNNQNKSNNKNDKEIIKIGAILPLTGPGSVFANYIKNGINLAVNEINRDSTSKFNFIVVFEDSQTKAKEGVNSYKKLISKDNVDVIIVALSSVAEAIKGYSAKDKIPQIGIAVATTDYTKNNDYVFRVYPNANTMAGTMAEYNTSVLNLKQSGIIYIDDDFGRASDKAYKKKFESNGGRVIFSESYKIIQKDFKNIITKLKEQKTECIYLNGYGQSYPAFIKQLYSSVKYKFTLTADMTMGLPTTIKNIGNISDTIYYVDADMDTNFINKYISEYDSQPTSYSGYAYDIIFLINESLKNKEQEKTSEFIKQNLFNIKEYNGVMGKISIDETGDCNLDFNIKTIINGKIN